MCKQMETSTSCLPELTFFFPSESFLLTTARYKYGGYNAQSVTFNLLLEYKTTERAIGLISFYKEDCIYLKKKYGITHKHTSRRGMFKNMVSFWMPKEKRFLLQVKICSVKVLYLRNLLILQLNVSFWI